MDIFNNLALPISEEHIKLLNLLLITLRMVFIIYSGLTFGLLISNFFLYKEKSNSQDGFEICKIITEKIVINKSILISFGILPLFSILLINIQIYPQKYPLIQLNSLLATVFSIIAYYFLYNYKKSLLIIKLYKSLPKSSEVITELNDSETEILFNKKNLYYSFFSLLLSALFFVVSFTLSADPELRLITNNIEGIFNFPVIINFIKYILIAIIFFSQFFLFYFFGQDGKVTHLSLRRFLLILLISSLLILPFMIMISFSSTSILAISQINPIILFISLLFIVVLLNLVYSLFKEFSYLHLKLSFLTTILLLVLFLINDQYHLYTSSKVEFLVINESYIKEGDMIKSKLGYTAEKINGEDIYNSKCSACHKFDVKLVGPPYKETLPKYVGNKAKLVSFILNPTKVNPQYPPMPAQGLKPNEAEAIAEFILMKYK